jgi:putative ABC transport system permease protein
MLHWGEKTIQDIRFALRSFGRAPVFTIGAVATLAIGIGANTAIFSVVSGVLLRPLRLIDPQTLVQLYETQPRDTVSTGFDGPVVFQDFDQWRSRSRLLAGMVTYTNSARNLQGIGEPERVATVTAERGLFRLLGVEAFVGRTFGEGDPLNVVVASYGFWRGHLGADASAIGRTITLDGEPFTLIGVMPEGFQFPYTLPPTGCGFHGRLRRTFEPIPRGAWTPSWRGLNQGLVWKRRARNSTRWNRHPRAAVLCASDP